MKKCPINEINCFGLYGDLITKKSSLNNFGLNSIYCVCLSHRSRAPSVPMPSSSCRTAPGRRFWFVTKTRASTSTPTDASPRIQCCSGGRCLRLSVSFTHTHTSLQGLKHALQLWLDVFSVVCFLNNGLQISSFPERWEPTLNQFLWGQIWDTWAKNNMLVILCVSVCVCAGVGNDFIHIHTRFRRYGKALQLANNRQMLIDAGRFE